MPEDPDTKAARDACFAEFAQNDPALTDNVEMAPPDVIEWLAGAAARRAGRHTSSCAPPTLRALCRPVP